MMHSKPHKHLFITDLEWAIEPPISLNRCDPLGGMTEAAKELRETVFKGKKVKSFQPAPDGSGMAVVGW